ncbi:MAG: asparaginase [Candidatus Nomurabacteria bacterium]|jgi:L-asparaginase|nr:asparaginase [Candidatus Nomurabacteria bacterium]
MSKKIAVLTCGGTIAMRSEEGGALHPALTGQELVNRIPNLQQTDTEFDVIEVFNKDSTNVTPEDWTTLAHKISEVCGKYSGIIVPHGTDTMAYTASAISLAFGRQLPTSIIFTGSQLPLGELRSDAERNVESAVQVAIAASRENIKEVMIVFDDRVLRGNRTIKTSEINFDAFDSPAFPHLADLTADSNTVFSPLANKTPPEEGELLTNATFSRGVLEISANTTTNPEMLIPSVLGAKCQAIILRSVGAGNVPDDDANSQNEKVLYSFLPLIKAAMAAGKSAILTSSFVGGRARPDMYAPGVAALKAGAGHAGNMTDVTAKVKLMWLLAQGVTAPNDVNEKMLVPTAGELDP